jgi:hypothetical protein
MDNARPGSVEMAGPTGNTRRRFMVAIVSAARAASSVLRVIDNQRDSILQGCHTTLLSYSDSFSFLGCRFSCGLSSRDRGVTFSWLRAGGS